MIKINPFQRSFSLILIILLLFNVQSVSAQANTGNNIIKRDRLRVNFWENNVLFKSLKIDHNGADLLKSRPAFSGEIGTGINTRLTEKLGLNLGLGWGLLTSDMHYSFSATIPGTKNTGILDLNEYSVDNNYYIYSASLNYSVFLPHNYEIIIGPGFRVNSFLGYPAGWSVNSSYRISDTSVFTLFQSTITGLYDRNIFSYTLEIGALRQTKRNNTLSLSLLLLYSPEKIGRGEYRFYNLPFESYGNITYGMNYIGLQFNCGLSLRRKYYKE